MRTTAKTGIGLALIAVGVIGVLVPLVPGVPFLVAGAALLGTDHPMLRPIIERLGRWCRHRREDSR